MQHRAFRHLLTFVLLMIFAFLHPIATRAAVSQPTPDYIEPASPTDPPADPSADVMTRQSLDIANPPLPPRSRDVSEYFHRYRRSLTIRVGPYRELDENNRGMIYGLIYNFPAFGLQSLEAGADLLSGGSGALHLAKRFEFSRSRFRPFLKAGVGVGVGVRVVPSEQLTSFLKGANYQLRGGGGFEISIRHAESVRVDAALLLMSETQQILGTIGYVWAW